MLQDSENHSDPSCYITYEKYQWEVYKKKKSIKLRVKSPRADGPSELITPTSSGLSPSACTEKNANESSPQIFDDVPYQQEETAAFKPTWLIDTSDMSVVRGSEVCEPYYTLSYSWNQSGDYFKNEHDDGYTRIDRGQHKVVLDMTPIYRSGNSGPRRMRHVKFEELVQEICKDFNVRYLWWDQMCIDQSNKEEKRREIKQMHTIYEHACRTLVLVPEFEFTGREDAMFNTEVPNFETIWRSQWAKRVWTLVEGYKSVKLLFIGKNVHMNSEVFDGTNELSTTNYFDALLPTICTTSGKWNICLGLSQAQERATTKKHDYYFAFANMFPKKLANLNFSYDDDIQEVALEFYKRLVQDDPSMLFFGAPHGEEKTERTLLHHDTENDFLPSWTGFQGVHALELFDVGDYDLSSFGLSENDYIFSGTTLQVTCSSIPVKILKNHEVPKPSVDDQPKLSQEEVWTLLQVFLNPREPIELRSSGDSHLTFIEKENSGENEGAGFESFQLKRTHFLCCKMDEPYEHFYVAPTAVDEGIGKLSLTEDCTDCIILFGIRYLLKESKNGYFIAAPVITSDGDHYKSIGLCVFERNIVMPDIDTETKKTFIIR